MRVPAILLTKEGEIVEIIAHVISTRFGFQIYGYNDYDNYYRRRFIKCPKGCVARRTSSHVYDIYVDPSESIPNPYMTGFDIELAERIIGDVIILKRPIYQRTFVPFKYGELSRFYSVRRYIYPAGSRNRRLIRIPLTYFALSRLQGRRRSYGRVYRKKLLPRFFRLYNKDYRIRRTPKGYYMSGRRTPSRLHLPLFGSIRHRRSKRPIKYSNKRLVRRPIQKKIPRRRPPKKERKKT